ncbi:MAG TPA: hypothetical protein VIV60_15380 [Polyangiaceae bacterium]
MSSITGYMQMAQTAARGITRDFDRAGKAAEQVVQNAMDFSSGDKVAVSPEAVAAAKDSSALGTAGIERPMVDLRVAKYSAMANVRVLQTADQMAADLAKMI